MKFGQNYDNYYSLLLDTKIAAWYSFETLFCSSYNN